MSSWDTCFLKHVILCTWKLLRTVVFAQVICTMSILVLNNGRNAFVILITISASFRCSYVCMPCMLCLTDLYYQACRAFWCVYVYVRHTNVMFIIRYASYLFCSPKWQGYFVYHQAWHLLHLMYDVSKEILGITVLRSIGLFWAHCWASSRLSCFNKLHVPGHHSLSHLDHVAWSI